MAGRAHQPTELTNPQSSPTHRAHQPTGLTNPQGSPTQRSAGDEKRIPLFEAARSHLLLHHPAPTGPRRGHPRHHAALRGQALALDAVALGAGGREILPRRAPASRAGHYVVEAEVTGRRPYPAVLTLELVTEEDVAPRERDRRSTGSVLGPQHDEAGHAQPAPAGPDRLEGRIGRESRPPLEVVSNVRLIECVRASDEQKLKGLTSGCQSDSLVAPVQDENRRTNAIAHVSVPYTSFSASSAAESAVAPMSLEATLVRAPGCEGLAEPCRRLRATGRRLLEGPKADLLQVLGDVRPKRGHRRRGGRDDLLEEVT